MLNHEEKYFTKLVSALNININEGEMIKTYDQDKKKIKQFLLINAKIGFFIVSKPKMRRKTKVKYFVSYFDIEEIDYASKNTISILYKSEGASETLSIEMSNESSLQSFVVNLVENYLKFSSDSPYFKPLKINNLPFEVSQQQKLINDGNSTVLRYLSACAKYHQPPDQNTKTVFEQYQVPNDLYMIEFDDRCQMPIHYKTIALPLIHAANLKVLKFDGFAPRTICKIIYYILKHTKRITTIILKNYQNLDFAFFNFSRFEKPSVVSWSISNCNFDEPSQQLKFFEEFQNYKGDIQKFTIDKYKFPIVFAEKIAKILGSAYCFRTLEVLEITEPIISQSNSSEVNTVFEYFRGIVRHLKVLQKFTLSNFEIKPNLVANHKKTLKIIKTGSLRHLRLSHVDFRKEINPIKFPSTINIIEFPHCSFNSTSLINLLKGSSEVRPPLVLNLSSMQIEQTELNIYYKNSHEIPQLNNLIELNYSKNSIAAAFVPEFCRIFLPPGIRFLSLNNCFGPQHLTPLHRIFNHLASTTSINGIELRGGKKETTFGPVMRPLIPGLQKLTTLSHIDISGQNWYMSFKNDIYKFILSMKDLKNFLTSGAGFPSAEALTMFYTYLIDNTPLAGVGNPINDIESLPKNEENQKILNGPVFERLKLKIRNKVMLSNTYIRSFYYLRYMDLTKFSDFEQKFPITLLDLSSNKLINEYTTINHQRVAIRTLLDLEMNELENESLSDFQVKFIESPIEEVEVKTQHLKKFSFPKLLHSFIDKYDSTFASTLTRPTIQNKVNAKEVMAKYRGWICKKNQRLFKNLSIASTLFDKVYEDELRGMMFSMSKMNEEFGKNIPVLEPPTYVSSEAIKVISTQLDTFGMNDDSDSEENSHFISGKGGSFSENRLSAVSSSQLLSSNYDDRKPFSRTNSSEYSSFTSDNDENSFTRSSFSAFSSNYGKSETSSVPHLSPLASSFRNSDDTLNTKLYVKGHSRKARKIGESSSELFLPDLSNNDEFYELENEINDENYLTDTKKQNINKYTDFSKLDVYQYAMKPSQDLNINQKQLDYLQRIREAATYLANFRPVRQIRVRRMPKKAAKVDPSLPELFDTLIGTSRTYCKTITKDEQSNSAPSAFNASNSISQLPLQQPQLSQSPNTEPAKAKNKIPLLNLSPKKDEGLVTASRDRSQSVTYKDKRKSNRSSLIPYMIEDIDINNKAKDESIFSNSNKNFFSSRNNTINAAGAAPMKQKSAKENSKLPAAIAMQPIAGFANLMNHGGTREISSARDPPINSHERLPQESLSLEINPLNISQNPFSRSSYEEQSPLSPRSNPQTRSNASANNLNSFSPPTIKPLNISNNPLSQPGQNQTQQQQQPMSIQQQLQQHQIQQQKLIQQQQQQPKQQSQQTIQTPTIQVQQVQGLRGTLPVGCTFQPLSPSKVNSSDDSKPTTSLNSALQLMQQQQQQQQQQQRTQQTPQQPILPQSVQAGQNSQQGLRGTLPIGAKLNVMSPIQPNQPQGQPQMTQQQWMQQQQYMQQQQQQRMQPQQMQQQRAQPQQMQQQPQMQQPQMQQQQQRMSPQQIQQQRAQQQQFMQQQRNPQQQQPRASPQQQMQQQQRMPQQQQPRLSPQQLQQMTPQQQQLYMQQQRIQQQQQRMQQQQQQRMPQQNQQQFMQQRITQNGSMSPIPQSPLNQNNQQALRGTLPIGINLQSINQAPFQNNAQNSPNPIPINAALQQINRGGQMEPNRAAPPNSQNPPGK